MKLSLSNISVLGLILQNLITSDKRFTERTNATGFSQNLELKNPKEDIKIKTCKTQSVISSVLTFCVLKDQINQRIMKLRLRVREC